MQSPSLTPLSTGKPSEKSPFGRRTLEIFGERQALTRLMIVGPKTIFLNNELVTDTSFKIFSKSTFVTNVSRWLFFAFSTTWERSEDVVVDLS